MRESTRARYEQLRRRRKHLRWHSIHQRRLSLGFGLLAVGVVLLAFTLWSRPDAAMPLSSAVVNDEQGSSLRATAVSVGGSEPLGQLSPTPYGYSSEPALLFDNWRFSSEPGLSVEAIRSILERHPGVLKDQVMTVGDREHSFAEVLVGQSALYGINPRIILALLELQQNLLSDPDPDDDQLIWALGYEGEDGRLAGFSIQLRWAVRELRRGVRDFPAATELIFEDESRAPVPANLNVASYAVMRVLARSATPEQFEQLAGDGPGSFLAVYTELFEDPRQPLSSALAQPAKPFLTYPLDKLSHITSFFDHEYPFLVQNGSLVSYWDRRETEISYDGHDGWDYGARPPTGIIAAAPGTVIFAGNSDDGCGLPARGVIIDHGNGYRTLYWHLQSVEVTTGQTVERGDRLGVVGATGCATGPHLHFQVHFLGRSTDPYGWCGEPASDPWAVHPLGIDSRWLWMDRPDPCWLPQDALVVSAGSENFVTTGKWDVAPVGVQGGSFWAKSLPPMTATTTLSETGSLSGTAVLSETSGSLSGMVVPPTVSAGFFDQHHATATWYPQLPAAGRYRMLAYIPYFFNGLADAREVRYEIRHAGGSSEVRIDQHVMAGEWADLGTYTFEPSGEAWVKLTNKTGKRDEGIWAGAMLWMPEP